ncbi:MULTISPECIES: DUF4062 domain-containing protein [Clostridium]|uniref:DUF4062 domain-containing protein n=1 Tax=Clostridium frigoriphilum TaxID=443253 RepID=A0ABU7UVX7_9CLOT|nr:DUF4062 domain-containing protein [Clostridium sp. DSM 17811]MBU3101930.1 DUF4062 domain-containing protein [Clostridium sp. DSM 17811]
MAKPRVFISSTFYDLHHVRADLEKFINEIGYESILNEQGNIPYGSSEKLEEYCYKEVVLADILVAIIGGRYGSASNYESHSITQKEIESALEANKQVYMFVEKSVLSEFETYLLNIDNKEIKYKFVDNILIFQYISKFKLLLKNNTIHGFESSQDITKFLKEQWAGLFQRFLQEQRRVEEVNLIRGIETTANTLNQLVTFFTTEKKDKDQAIKDILLSNHPAMEQLRELLDVKYRVYFTTYEELNIWLKARSYKSGKSLKFVNSQSYGWINVRHSNKILILEINKDIFDEKGKLKVFTNEEWDNSKIALHSNINEESILEAAATIDGDTLIK